MLHLFLSVIPLEFLLLNTNRAIIFNHALFGKVSNGR